MNPPKFSMGDVVSYVGNNRVWKKKEQHIIHEVTIHNEVAYSTTNGAWFDETDFVLVRKADTQSMRKLFQHVQDEEEDGIEEV